MKNIKTTFALVAMFLSLLLSSEKSYAHCEVPCGIYADSIRISMINEHIITIEKSMKKIVELSKKAAPNYNQLVRWVTNKEEHAKKIQEIVSQYFLHQRVKITDPSDKEHFSKYVKLLTTLHEISVYAMKTKQSTDLANIAKLKKSVEDFSTAYFHSHKH